MSTSDRDPLHARHVIDLIEQVIAFIQVSLADEINGRPIESLQAEPPATEEQKRRKIQVVNLLREMMSDPFKSWIPDGILLNPKEARVPQYPPLPDGDCWEKEIQVWGIRNPDARDQAVYLRIEDSRDHNHPQHKDNPHIHWPGGLSPTLKTPEAPHPDQLQATQATADCALNFLKKWKDKIKQLAQQEEIAPQVRRNPPIAAVNQPQPDAAPIQDEWENQINRKMLQAYLALEWVAAGAPDSSEDDRPQADLRNHEESIARAEIFTLVQKDGDRLIATRPAYQYIVKHADKEKFGEWSDTNTSFRTFAAYCRKAQLAKYGPKYAPRGDLKESRSIISQAEDTGSNFQSP